MVAQTLHDSPFHLSDLHVVGGPNGAAVKVDGAGIQETSPRILTNVTVSDAHDGSGGSAVAFDYGSAVHDVELHGVTISDNVGDGVSNTSNNSGVLVTDSTIAFNSGGGLVVADGSPIDMTNSAVTDNGGYGVFTTGQGNGLQPIVTVIASEIARNGRGGLTCRAGCRSLTITSSDVSDNGAAAAAGSGRRRVRHVPARVRDADGVDRRLHDQRQQGPARRRRGVDPPLRGHRSGPDARAARVAARPRQRTSRRSPAAGSTTTPLPGSVAEWSPGRSTHSSIPVRSPSPTPPSAATQALRGAA